MLPSGTDLQQLAGVFGPASFTYFCKNLCASAGQCVRTAADMQDAPLHTRRPLMELPGQALKTVCSAGAT